MIFLWNWPTMLVGICLTPFFVTSIEEFLYDDDYKAVNLNFSAISNITKEQGNDYEDYAEYEINSIMKDAMKLFQEQEEILNEYNRPSDYISTNRDSEKLASEERLLNAIKYGLKKESCKSKTNKVKQYCKNNKGKKDYGRNKKVNNKKETENVGKSNRDYNDYDEDADAEITKKVKKFLKKADVTFNYRGASSEKGSKETDGMCNPMKYKISCDPDKRWRHINGTCNNLEKPHWGSMVILFPRFSQSTYDDGPMGYIPRGGWRQTKAPYARYLSEFLSHPKYPATFEGGKKHDRHRTHGDDIPSDLFTHMSVSWGQFLAHELSMTTEPERDCCNNAILEGQNRLPPIARSCWNINISNDEFFKKANVTCHPYSRSNFFICPKNSAHPGVQQVNGVTAFVDGSAIYGEDIIKNIKLRQMKDGLLKTGRNKTHPVATKLPEARHCGFKSGHFFIENETTEVAGDPRAAIQPSLASMHTLFMVEHNRIAKELKKRLHQVKLPNGVTMDELLFQETRIIIIALQQKITYNDYLPSVLGNQKWKSNKFYISPSTYFPNEDASIRNEFTTAAFRFGHSNTGGRWDPVSTDVNNKIGKLIPEFNAKVSIPPFWPLRWHYFDTALFVTSFNGEEWNEELLGTIYQPAQKTDLYVTDDLTDYLFSKSFSELLPSEIESDKGGDFPSQDLVARNIHRGRDHGLATYNDMRKFCKLKPLESFKQQPKEIMETTWNELAKAYKNVNQIDLYLGGYAETTLNGAMVGPTFACIIEKQFQLLKQGDRHFFSHRQGLHHKGVSQVLYKQMLRRTLGDIMCTNMVILKNNGTQKDVFRLKNDQSNPYIPCKERQDLNFDIIAKDILQFYNKGLIQISNKIENKVEGNHEKQKINEKSEEIIEITKQENGGEETHEKPNINEQPNKLTDAMKKGGNPKNVNTSHAQKLNEIENKVEGNHEKQNINKIPAEILEITKQGEKTNNLNTSLTQITNKMQNGTNGKYEKQKINEQPKNSTDAMKQGHLQISNKKEKKVEGNQEIIGIRKQGGKPNNLNTSHRQITNKIENGGEETHEKQNINEQRNKLTDAMKKGAKPNNLNTSDTQITNKTENGAKGKHEKQKLNEQPEKSTDALKQGGKPNNLNTSYTQITNKIENGAKGKHEKQKIIEQPEKSTDAMKQGGKPNNLNTSYTQITNKIENGAKGKHEKQKINEQPEKSTDAMKQEGNPSNLNTSNTQITNKIETGAKGKHEKQNINDQLKTLIDAMKQEGNASNLHPSDLKITTKNENKAEGKLKKKKINEQPKTKIEGIKPGGGNDPTNKIRVRKPMRRVHMHVI